MEGLLPDRATLDTWATLSDAAACGGLEGGLVRSVVRQLGDPSSLHRESALTAATRSDRQLTETEKAQWRLVMSAVRVKFGGVSLFATTAVSPTPATPTGGGGAMGLGGAKLKLKMSQIIDQGVDLEVEMLSGPILQKMR